MNFLNKSSLRVISLLEDAGFECYAVGGCVRDFVLGIVPHDVDFTTNASVVDMKKVFSGARLKTYDTGLQHGTITVGINGEMFEVTTYRIDGDYSDGRHPDSVTFTDKLENDLARRDFTFNAMAFNPKTGIVDPYNGQADLRSKLVRCVGDASRRFNEDGLRIMRALRFASRFGFSIEGSTARSIHSCKGTLKNVSRERVFGELLRILESNVGVSSLFVEFSDVMAEIIPEFRVCIGFDQKNPHHDKDVYQHMLAAVDLYSGGDVAISLGLLLHDIGKPSTAILGEDRYLHFHGHEEKSAELADNILLRFKVDNALRNDVVNLIRLHGRNIVVTDKAVKRALNNMGVDTFKKLLIFKEADVKAHKNHGDCLNRLKEIYVLREEADNIVKSNKCFTIKALDVDGYDMMELGYNGKAIGDALNLLLDAVISDNIENKKDDLISYLKRL